MAEDQPPIEVPLDVDTANGFARPTRQQRRAQRQHQIAMERGEHVKRLKLLAEMERPLKQGEFQAWLERWAEQHKRDVQLLDDLRLAFNQLSVRHHALMKALLSQRVWGRAVLADVDYERALEMVKQEFQAQVEAERAASASPSPPVETPKDG